MKNVRTVLVLFLCLSLLGAIWGLKEHPHMLPRVQGVLEKEILTFEKQRAIAAANILAQRKVVQNRMVNVDLSSIQGRKLGDLYATYLGLPPGRVVPQSTFVSFEEQMATMYHKKVLFEKCKKKDPTKCTVSSDTVLSKAPGLLEQYIQGDKMVMDLPRFIAIADEKVRAGRASINWSALCKRGYRLESAKCDLLKSIVDNITGRDLVAYGMTELLPSADGRLNVKYMDILLRNAGAQFIYYVPALGDRYASLGLYQFTFFALREDSERVEGVNRVNAFVEAEGSKVPGSVVLLKGHQHHTAAFYFAVHNWAVILARLSGQEVATLTRLHTKELAAMIVVVAAAHHGPAHTVKTVRTWLKAVHESENPKKRGKGKKEVVNTNLLTLFPTAADMRMYAQKSYSNIAAVYEVK